MARAAVKAKQAAKQAQQAKTPAPKTRTRGRRKHASGGNPNQQLFFVRMRRSAKPAYLILAVLFAATFAFLGVGSGSSGLSGLFDNLNIFHTGGSSVSKALKEVDKHPNSAKAYRNLATVYETKGDTDGAISALENYTNLQKKDAAAFSELAGLQMTSAQDAIAQYENAYANEQLAAPSQALLPTPTSPVGKALGTNPIEQAAATQVNAAVSSLGEKVQLAYATAIASYQRVAALQPNDANAQFELAQAAQSAGDTTTAVAAYQKYLKLNPNGTTADEVRSLIKQLTKK